MGKKYLKVASISLLLSGLTLTNVGCNANEVKVTFVSENNSDIIRYVKKGKTLVDIPDTPTVKGKYCLWDRDNFQNLNEDITVHANCYSTVVEMNTNIDSEINVEISSPEANLDYIFKDLEIDVKFESGETKKVYEGEYTLETNGYNKDVSGSYVVGVVYNNAKKNVRINVNKIDNYVTVSLNSGKGYYNEGLPKLIANTSVEGEVSFDQGQTLVKGIKSYTWTFTPKDMNKYEIVKGKISVDLINASAIIANKNSLSVDFGTSKEEIIDLLLEDLVVKGKYDNLYKEIDSEYYTIGSDSFVVDKSGTFDFKISYDDYIYTIIPVTVNKCDTYVFNVNDINEFIATEDTTLDDVVSAIRKSSSVDGTISFVEGQTLAIGNYNYEYIFTPNNAHYEAKRGTIRIHSYRAKDISFTTNEEYDYGTSKEEILLELKNNIAGTIYYNDDLTKVINTNSVSITLSDNFDSLKAGEYTYTVSYNGEIEKTATLKIKKIVLQKVNNGEGDFTIACGEVDPDNYQVMPVCSIKRDPNSKYEFDANLFSVVPISSRKVNDIMYEYQAEIVPDDSIIENYERVIVTILITYYPNVGPTV